MGKQNVQAEKVYCILYNHFHEGNSRESYTCRRKGNQQQLDHAVQVLDKFDEASDALKAKSYDKVKAAFDSGTEVVSKRIKVIKMADKSDFGWSTVNEYLSDELASKSDDELLLYTLDLLCFHLRIYGVTPRPYPIFSSICWLFLLLVFLLTFGKCRMQKYLRYVV